MYVRCSTCHGKFNMGNLQPRSRSVNTAEFRELTTSWSAAADSCFISMRRKFRRIPMLSLFLLTVCAIAVYTVEYPHAKAMRPIPVLNTRIPSSPGPHKPASKSTGHRVYHLRTAQATRAAVDEIEDLSNQGHTQNVSMGAVSMIRELPGANSTIRKAYARLARSYLSSFEKRGKITNSSYMEFYSTSEGQASGCFLLQVKNGSIFLHDRQEVLTKMAPHRVLRLREALRWIESSVSRGVVDNFEMVISTTDGVATTSKNHSYRMPAPGPSRPIFGSITCNVSDNIPFPLMLSDVLRRGVPHEFWEVKSQTVDEWDDAMDRFARLDADVVPWNLKKARAVFRGRIRISAFLRQRDDFDESCDRVGRTALWAQAQKHGERLRKWAHSKALEKRIWPWPILWFLPKTESLLDVKIDGTCGKRIYVSDKMSMQKQAGYKYIVHVEGNSFWADRLLLLLFGSSAILKQETPCGMFFEPLLKPNVHYIGVDFWFGNVVRKIKWARGHDEEVLQIVRNARQFAADYLSTSGIQTYVDELLKQYVKLLANRRIEVCSGAVKVYP
ncbi:Glycosyltransferase family GT90 [Gracilaria domingensis]|nr:Glycosyltransferase family GT90 [Gracilaria domingensis]